VQEAHKLAQQVLKDAQKEADALKRSAAKEAEAGVRGADAVARDSARAADARQREMDRRAVALEQREQSLVAREALLQVRLCVCVGGGGVVEGKGHARDVITFFSPEAVIMTSEDLMSMDAVTMICTAGLWVDGWMSTLGMNSS
jgi:hypothetical protein